MLVVSGMLVMSGQGAMTEFQSSLLNGCAVYTTAGKMLLSSAACWALLSAINDLSSCMSSPAVYAASLHASIHPQARIEDLIMDNLQESLKVCLTSHTYFMNSSPLKVLDTHKLWPGSTAHTRVSQSRPWATEACFIQVSAHCATHMPDP
jgi:hypothetical protein